MRDQRAARKRLPGSVARKGLRNHSVATTNGRDVIVLGPGMTQQEETGVDEIRAVRRAHETAVCGSMPTA